MKKIKLSKNAFALVDDDMFDYLNQWKWYCSSVGYAVRDIWVNKKKIAILMHRFITNATEKSIVDHINGDKLDNRRNNLRNVTQHENQLNRHKLNKNNLSGHRGVNWMISRHKWRVRLMVNYNDVHIGMFSDLEKAVLARQLAEDRYFGSGRTKTTIGDFN